MAMARLRPWILIEDSLFPLPLRITQQRSEADAFDSAGWFQTTDLRECRIEVHQLHQCTGSDSAFLLTGN